jgi:ADP-ribosylglycohydrolase
MDKVTKDKYTGCLLGGAVGDALGAPIEFLSLAQIRSKYGQA